MEIRIFEDAYRDDLIFMVLQAKDALGRKPKINEDLLDIQANYFDRGDMFWIAVDGKDRVIGCVGYSKTAGMAEAFLHRLYVKPSEKHKGIGTALLKTAEASLRDSGITTAKVHLGSPKEQWFESYAFYPKHGYYEYAPGYMKKELQGPAFRGMDAGNTRKESAMADTINIALLQILPTGSAPQNMEKGIRCCREAKAQGADIALFPEMWSSGYTIPHDPEKLAALAVAADGAFVMCFAALAKELEMAIGITFLEKSSAGPKNSICLFDRHGQLAYKYSKVHICDFGEPDDEGVLCAGDEFPVAALDTAKGVIKVGSMICYDREFPESARILMLKGAELLLVPNACPMEINRLSQLRGRAYENMLAIATCNYPAPHPDCNGHSTLFDGVAYLPGLRGSRDTCVLEAGGAEGIFLARLDIAMLREYRRREAQNLRNRRPELYGILAER